MPLSFPSGGGLDRRVLLAELALFSDGPDASINFAGGSYDGQNNQALIGGDNSFCGSMANILSGKIAEFAALPSTVITGGAVSDIYLNNVDGGIVLRIANEFARSADAGASWTDITPGIAATYKGIQSWRNAQLIYLHDRLAGPSRDYIVSSDNGATFGFTTGFSGIAGVGREGIHKADDDKLIVIHGQGPAIGWSDDADLTAAAWNSFDFSALLGALGVVLSVATNGNASHAIVTTDTGDIITSTDGLNTWTLFDRDLNPFQDGDNPAFGLTIDNVTFVADLGGYFLSSDAQVGFFIPDDSSLNAGKAISFINTASVSPAADTGLTDNANLLIPATLNNSLRTLPAE